MAKTPKMIHCSQCGKEIEKSAKICAGCGKKRGLFQRHPIRTTLIAIPIFFIVLAIITPSSKKETSTGGNSTQVEEKIETPAVDPVEAEKAYKAECKAYAYKTIARKPDDFKGNKARFKGEVVRVAENWGVNILRVNTKYNEYVGYNDNTIYVEYTAQKGDARILEGDIITLWGELDGIETYETVMGSSVSIPRMKIAYYKITE